MTALSEAILAEARQVLAEAAAGHQHGSQRIEWAQGVVDKHESAAEVTQISRGNHANITQPHPDSNVEMRSPVDWTGK